MSFEQQSEVTPAERARLAEIVELDLFSEDVSAELDGLAKQAAEKLGLPIGLVSIVLDEAQHFAAAYGLDGWIAETSGTPIEWAFCRFTVESGQPFVVEDATEHLKVAANPLVINEGIRCYAGIPLVTSKGNTIGTLCVIGVEPKTFAQRELAALQILATEAVTRLELRRKR